MPDIYGIKIVGYGDNPIMIDHHGIVQTWVDTVIENIDNGFPVIINFYLPAMVSYVRQMRLNLRFEHFRAYDKAAGNFGGTTTQNTTSHSHDISISLEAFGTGSMSGSTSRKVTSDPEQSSGGVWHSHGDIDDHYRYETSHSHNYSDTVSTESTEVHKHDTRSHGHPIGQGIWEDSALDPSDVTVKINGEDVEGEFEDTVEDIKIPKEELVFGWNTLEIKSKSLGRISASYFLQVFMSV